ncbi:ABC transporter ATP-binding protein [Ruminococcus sp.]|uniref:ABC transporter ATP-binding protein n=1 Tax=Ruminococcus sp. TaxID=41978 RepID=UPI001B4F1AEC|nr:ABC transporter ATP-binding protein [Ruminococcus sp.]MBP5431102.1 ABC transporter ATP-binding protein [Ruminococcus sp.]
MELMKIENLCKTYGKGENEVKALDNVSFTIPKGQMLAVIGPSGSGKSTLLHILGGVDRPTSGKVFLDNQDVFAQNNKDLAIFRRRQVGLIYQFYNLIPVLDAEENITLPLIMDGRKPDPKHLDKLLEMLQIKERRHHLPSQLSGGQQQRVSIGRALFTSPGVILADEPTGNLDSKNSAEIMKLLQQSNREFEQTMVIITHDENIALQCDRIITLTDGKIVSDKLNNIK